MFVALSLSNCARFYRILSDIMVENIIILKKNYSEIIQLSLFPYEDRKKEELLPEACLSSLFERLAESKFRSSFHLSSKDVDYIREKGLELIRSHAEDFVDKRLAPAVIANDGKQTPMRGHPVFVAQHAFLFAIIFYIVNSVYLSERYTHFTVRSFHFESMTACHGLIFLLCKTLFKFTPISLRVDAVC